MLYALTTKDEIRTTTSEIFSKLFRLAHDELTIIYASAGGNAPINIFYSHKYQFWWGNKFDDYRFWNPFGLEKPKDGSTVTGRCQINYLSDGYDNSMAGLLAKDIKGNAYILHSGRIGGGQKGVGKNAFLDYYSGNRTLVKVGNQELEYFIVAKVNSPRFYKSLLEFIKAVYNFKESVKSGYIKPSIGSGDNPLSNGEYMGIKTYNLPERTIIATHDHAIITNQLIDELKARGYRVKRDRFRDAYTLDTAGKTINRIFEVKAFFSRQGLYTAIGQLQLHSLAFNSQKYFVIDDTVDKSLIQDLAKLQISCLTFQWNDDNESVSFSDLDKL